MLISCLFYLKKRYEVKVISTVKAIENKERKAKRNQNLTAAKVRKNDEFYTRYEDIEKELENYKEFFKDKTVYCPCDNFNDERMNNFFKYFKNNFDKLKIKTLLCSYYIENGNSEYIKIKRIEENKERDYKLNERDNNASTYRQKLQGNGSFDSDECVELLKTADIVVTNPPFSRFLEIVKLCVDYDKKFLMIGNKNAILNGIVMPLFMNNKIWLGINNVKDFVQPDGSIKKFGNIGWFTNLENNKKTKRLKLTKEYYVKESKEQKRLENYENKDYPSFLNYNAINVDRVENIPKDYFGIMAVPLSFLDKYNPEQFEIIGAGRNMFNEKLGFQKIGKEVMKKYRAQGGTGNYTENMHSLVYEKDGKVYFPYQRILIKRRK